MWWFLLAGGLLWVVSLCFAWCLCIIAKRADEAAREHNRMSGCATHGFPRSNICANYERLTEDDPHAC
jgi:hypothetical protein